MLEPFFTVTANKHVAAAKIKTATGVNSGIVGDGDVVGGVGVGLGDTDVLEESDITEILLLSE